MLVDGKEDKDRCARKLIFTDFIRFWVPEKDKLKDREERKGDVKRIVVHITMSKIIEVAGVR